jgi:hypothetical protein
MFVTMRVFPSFRRQICFIQQIELSLNDLLTRSIFSHITIMHGIRKLL